MNVWFGKAIFIISFVTIWWFREPHVKRNKQVKVVDNRKTKLEFLLINTVTVGAIIIPALWMAFDIWSFADYPLCPPAVVIGTALSAIGIWLFRKSHHDLGTNWSPSLQVRESHYLVNEGIYKYVRHPMYSSLFVYGSAQIFLLPNWIVGSAGVAAFSLLYLFRVRNEERMMIDKFGQQYELYMKRTPRLIPYFRRG